MRSRENLLLNMYDAMLAKLGPSYWWPGASAFEVMVGAVLTQNTNWGNVTRAVDNLRDEDLLTPAGLDAIPEARLAELVRPAGYFRLKAARLKNLLGFLRKEYRYDIDALAEANTGVLREKLLCVKGIGPETADSILLYALNLPSFVVDVYTRRICNRHGLLPEDVSYDELREYFMDVLPEDVHFYKEFHALLVRTAQGWCKKKAPACDDCPLHCFLQ